MVLQPPSQYDLIYPTLFIWSDCRHYYAKETSCHDIPVMAILKEFRAMAGPKGRKQHRLFPPAMYEYEKNRVVEQGSGSASSSQAVLPPPTEEEEER